MTSHALRRLAAVLALGLLAAGAPAPGGARAEADGPDFYRVTGLEPGELLNIRAGPGLDQPRIGAIPYGTDGLANLGCEGGLSLAEWEQASEAERAAGLRTRWCRIRHMGIEGWVAGWHLAEGAAPADAAGPAEPQLAGTTWRLTGFGTTAAVGETWLNIAPDGTITGSGGCNRFNGAVTVDAASAAFAVSGPVAATMMACAEPGVSEQEAGFFAALEKAVRYSFDLRTGALRILDAAGETLMEFAPRM
jgi:heat shock protein HslJ